jgi:hypothetical protein
MNTVAVELPSCSLPQPRDTPSLFPKPHWSLPCRALPYTVPVFAGAKLQQPHSHSVAAGARWRIPDPNSGHKSVVGEP